MKKSAKCKTVPQQVGVPQGLQRPVPGVAKPQTVANPVPGEPKKDPAKEQDIVSLLKYIEGSKQEECKDPKKAAKRARQKQKKQEEKEKQEEEEAERKRLEAMKRQVTISLVSGFGCLNQSTSSRRYRDWQGV